MTEDVGFMAGVVAGLVGAVIGITGILLILHRRRRELECERMGFRFRKLRDRLQLLAVKGEVSVDSPTYLFGMWLVNVAIKNVRDMKLRDVIWLAERIDDRVRHGGEALWDDFTKNQPRAVQTVVGQTFIEFAHVMAANDPFVALGLRIYRLTPSASGRANRRSVLEQLERVAERLLPAPRGRSLQHARGLVDLGRQIMPGEDRDTLPLFPTETAPQDDPLSVE